MSSKLKLSTKQKNILKTIKDRLNIKFTGSTYQELNEFIDQYLPTIKEQDSMLYLKPSSKQMKGINLINRFLDKTLSPENMRQASNYISEYLEEALAKASEYNKKIKEK